MFACLLINVHFCFFIIDFQCIIKNLIIVKLDHVFGLYVIAYISQMIEPAALKYLWFSSRFKVNYYIVSPLSHMIFNHQTLKFMLVHI